VTPNFGVLENVLVPRLVSDNPFLPTPACSVFFLSGKPFLWCSVSVDTVSLPACPEGEISYDRFAATVPWLKYVFYLFGATFVMSDVHHSSFWPPSPARRRAQYL